MSVPQIRAFVGRCVESGSWVRAALFLATAAVKNPAATLTGHNIPPLVAAGNGGAAPTSRTLSPELQRLSPLLARRQAQQRLHAQQSQAQGSDDSAAAEAHRTAVAAIAMELVLPMVVQKSWTTALHILQASTTNASSRRLALPAGTPQERQAVASMNGLLLHMLVLPLTDVRFRENALLAAACDDVGDGIIRGSGAGTERPFRRRSVVAAPIAIPMSIPSLSSSSSHSPQGSSGATPIADQMAAGMRVYKLVRRTHLGHTPSQLSSLAKALLCSHASFARSLLLDDVLLLVADAYLDGQQQGSGDILFENDAFDDEARKFLVAPDRARCWEPLLTKDAALLRRMCRDGALHALLAALLPPLDPSGRRAPPADVRTDTHVAIVTRLLSPDFLAAVWDVALECVAAPGSSFPESFGRRGTDRDAAGLPASACSALGCLEVILEHFPFASANAAGSTSKRAHPIAGAGDSRRRHTSDQAKAMAVFDHLERAERVLLSSSSSSSSPSTLSVAWALAAIARLRAAATRHYVYTSPSTSAWSVALDLACRPAELPQSATASSNHPTSSATKKEKGVPMPTDLAWQAAVTCIASGGFSAIKVFRKVLAASNCAVIQPSAAASTSQQTTAPPIHHHAPATPISTDHHRDQTYTHARADMLAKGVLSPSALVMRLVCTAEHMDAITRRRQLVLTINAAAPPTSKEKDRLENRRRDTDNVVAEIVRRLTAEPRSGSRLELHHMVFLRSVLSPASPLQSPVVRDYCREGGHALALPPYSALSAWRIALALVQAQPTLEAALAAMVPCGYGHAPPEAFALVEALVPTTMIPRLRGFHLRHAAHMAAEALWATASAPAWNSARTALKYAVPIQEQCAVEGMRADTAAARHLQAAMEHMAAFRRDTTVVLATSSSSATRPSRTEVSEDDHAEANVVVATVADILPSKETTVTGITNVSANDTTDSSEDALWWLVPLSDPLQAGRWLAALAAASRHFATGAVVARVVRDSL